MPSPWLRRLRRLPSADSITIHSANAFYVLNFSGERFAVLPPQHLIQSNINCLGPSSFGPRAPHTQKASAISDPFLLFAVFAAFSLMLLLFKARQQSASVCSGVYRWVGVNAMFHSTRTTSLPGSTKHWERQNTFSIVYRFVSFRMDARCMVHSTCGHHVCFDYNGCAIWAVRFPPEQQLCVRQVNVRNSYSGSQTAARQWYAYTPMQTNIACLMHYYYYPFRCTVAVCRRCRQTVVEWR